MISWMISYT